MSGSTLLGVIGGTGLSHLLQDPQVVEPETPYGSPSAPITVGRLSGREVAFAARHGRHHHLPPDRVNSRANLWALRELGVSRPAGAGHSHGSRRPARAGLAGE
ncbi:MAG: hypothetical protein ACR2KC_07600 [Acidimicrobiales bacterium]